jgi:hypothetical protein
MDEKGGGLYTSSAWGDEECRHNFDKKKQKGEDYSYPGRIVKDESIILK